MAVSHIQFNSGTQHGAILRHGLTLLEDGLDRLNEIKATMQLMIDGDGSSDTHFAYMQEKFGFASNADAKACWDELNSVLFKLNTNDSVTSVNAAMLQAFAKFR